MGKKNKSYLQIISIVKVKEEKKNVENVCAPNSCETMMTNQISWFVYFYYAYRVSSV